VAGSTKRSGAAPAIVTIVAVGLFAIVGLIAIGRAGSGDDAAGSQPTASQPTASQPTASQPTVSVPPPSLTTGGAVTAATVTRSAASSSDAAPSITAATTIPAAATTTPALTTPTLRVTTVALPTSAAVTSVPAPATVAAATTATSVTTPPALPTTTAFASTVATPTSIPVVTSTTIAVPRVFGPGALTLIPAPDGVRPELSRSAARRQALRAVDASIERGELEMVFGLYDDPGTLTEPTGTAVIERRPVWVASFTGVPRRRASAIPEPRRPGVTIPPTTIRDVRTDVIVVIDDRSGRVLLQSEFAALPTPITTLPLTTRP
jgi:hypothetical protein